MGNPGTAQSKQTAWVYHIGVRKFMKYNSDFIFKSAAHLWVKRSLLSEKNVFYVGNFGYNFREILVATFVANIFGD